VVAIMRMHTWTGLAAGCIGFALLYVAQLGTGLGALALLALVGVLAGLGMAKWLPRDWYGRQLEAGARAGSLACALAVAGLWLSLILTGPHPIPVLARESHLLGLNLGQAVRALGGIGWVVPALVLSLPALVAGTAVAAIVTLGAAWDKNRHAIEVVDRAREAAQRSGSLPAAARSTGTSSRGLSPGATPGSAASGPQAWAAREAVQPPRRQTVAPAASAPIVPPSLPPDTGALRAALSAWAESSRAPAQPEGGGPADPGRTQPEPQRAPHRDPDRDNWLC
jgi:hypothetical protein